MPIARPRVLVRFCPFSVLLTLALLLSAPVRTQETGDTAMCSALRTLALGSESVNLSNVDLQRDAGSFRCRSGTVCFTAPVNGKVTGAVFVGDGVLLLNPP